MGDGFSLSLSTLTISRAFLRADAPLALLHVVSRGSGAPELVVSRVRAGVVRLTVVVEGEFALRTAAPPSRRSLAGWKNADVNGISGHCYMKIVTNCMNDIRPEPLNTFSSPSTSHIISLSCCHSPTVPLGVLAHL